MRLCKDCKYYDASRPDAKRNPHLYAECRNSGKESMVTGIATGFEPCCRVRIFDSMCGPEGKWFEAKEMEVA